MLWNLCVCRSPQVNLDNFILNLSLLLNRINYKFDKLLEVGDFSMEPLGTGRTYQSNCRYLLNLYN